MAMHRRRDILAVGGLLALSPHGLIGRLRAADVAAGATATSGPVVLALDSPAVARVGYAVPIGIRAVAAEIGGGIAALRLSFGGRPFGGLAYLAIGGARTAELDWHIRLERTETLVLTVDMMDGTSHTVWRRLTII
jgi:hypothetical protein